MDLASRKLEIGDGRLDDVNLISDMWDRKTETGYWNAARISEHGDQKNEIVNINDLKKSEIEEIIDQETEVLFNELKKVGE